MREREEEVRIPTEVLIPYRKKTKGRVTGISAKMELILVPN